MSSNLRIFPCTEVDPDALIQKARDWNLDTVLITGYSDGNFVWGSSTLDLKELLFLQTLLKQEIEHCIEDGEYQFKSCVKMLVRAPVGSSKRLL